MPQAERKKLVPVRTLILLRANGTFKVGDHILLISAKKLITIKRTEALNSILIFIFIGLVSGCGNDSVDPRIIVSEAREQFGLQMVPMQTSPDKVFIMADISGSMAGFANVSDFPIRMSALHSSLAGIEREYFTLSSSLSQVEDHLGLLSNKIYSGAEANFGLISDIIDSAGAVIILTDLQFNNKEYYTKMVALFQELIADNKYVRLSASVADFDGTIYTQAVSPRRKFHSIASRPLYAITFSEKKYSQYLDEVLKTSGIWEYHIPLALDQSSSTNLKIRYDANEERPVNLSLINRAIQYWDTIQIDDIKFETFPIFEGKFNGEPVENNIQLLSTELLDQKVNFRFDFTQHKFVGTQLLKIEVKPREVPSWVKNISCMETGDGAIQATQTLWFDRFISEVISSVKNPFVIINEFTVIGDFY